MIGSKSHILYVPSWYPSPLDIQNGVFIQKHAQAAARHHNITVLFAYDANESSTSCKQDGGLTELITTFKRSSFSFLNKARLFRHYFQQFRKMKAVDIIHAHVWSNKTIIAYLLSVIYNKPLLISEHWSGYQNHIGFMQKAIMKLVFKRAKKILPVSNFLKTLMQKKGIKGRFEIIGNIIKKQQFKAVKDDVFRFLIVADLRDEIKNISSVIHSFQELRIDNYKLNIIGDGPDKSLLESMTKSDNIQFLGRMRNEDVLNEIDQHHALIINSRIETFSVVALESLAAGKPVIYTQCGGPTELIPSNCGYSIPIDNKKELKSVIIKMIKKYSFFETNKLQQAVNDFSEEVIGNKIKEAYHDILIHK